jgi:hypothetical protein
MALDENPTVTIDVIEMAAAIGTVYERRIREIAPNIQGCPQLHIKDKAES